MRYMTPKNRREFLESLLLDITHFKRYNFVTRMASTWRAMLKKAAECVTEIDQLREEGLRAGKCLNLM